MGHSLSLGRSLTQLGVPPPLVRLPKPVRALPKGLLEGRAPTFIHSYLPLRFSWVLASGRLLFAGGQDARACRGTGMGAREAEWQVWALGSRWVGPEGPGWPGALPGLRAGGRAGERAGQVAGSLLPGEPSDLLSSPPLHFRAAGEGDGAASLSLSSLLPSHLFRRRAAGEASGTQAHPSGAGATASLPG